jgi:hypothetical protein
MDPLSLRTPSLIPHLGVIIVRVEHVNAHEDVRLARRCRGGKSHVPLIKQTPAKGTMALGGGSALSTVN